MFSSAVGTEKKKRPREYRERLQWESLAGLADCSFIESLNDYKWSRSSPRYDLTKHLTSLRVVCVTRADTRTSNRLVLALVTRKREREREKERDRDRERDRRSDSLYDSLETNSEY